MMTNSQFYKTLQQADLIINDLHCDPSNTNCDDDSYCPSPRLYFIAELSSASMADNDSHEEDRKLFVGGLPQEVTQDDLDEYFGQFGELESAKLKMDPMTGRSRGFAFILYKEPDSIDRAADGTEHKLKGKTITVKKADVKPGKVYIGKLPDSGVGEDEIKEHFSQFGNIAEVIRPIDKMKNNEPKNFCFVTFERERVAKKLIEEGSCTINGHKMQIKQVTPNPRDPSQRGGRWR